MLIPRENFGICAVNNFIYVVGGDAHENSGTLGNSGKLGCISHTSWKIDQCDRYDVLKDSWQTLNSCKFPETPLSGNILVAINKRFIYTFGF
jgi:hypothetical protein